MGAARRKANKSKLIKGILNNIKYFGIGPYDKQM
jgi:hypothetical protein